MRDAPKPFKAERIVPTGFIMLFSSSAGKYSYDVMMCALSCKKQKFSVLGVFLFASRSGRLALAVANLSVMRFSLFAWFRALPQWDPCSHR